MGFLAALMGAVPALSATTLKPDEVTEQDMPVSELMAEVEKRRQEQTEPDMSDCIHVMHRDRMADMRGCTLLLPKGDKLMPVTINGRM